MDKWISGRFSAPSDVRASQERSNSSLMARTGAALYAAGATLALVWLALPHPVASQDALILAVVAVAYASAALMLWLGERLTLRQWELVVALGIALISCAIQFSGRLWLMPINATSCHGTSQSAPLSTLFQQKRKPAMLVQKNEPP